MLRLALSFDPFSIEFKQIQRADYRATGQILAAVQLRVARNSTQELPRDAAPA